MTATLASVLSLVTTCLAAVATAAVACLTMVRSMRRQSGALEWQRKACIRPVVLLTGDGRVWNRRQQMCNTALVNIGNGIALNVRARADDITDGSQEEVVPFIGVGDSHKVTTLPFVGGEKPPTSVWIDYEDAEGNQYHSKLQPDDTWTLGEGHLVENQDASQPVANRPDDRLTTIYITTYEQMSAERRHRVNTELGTLAFVGVLIVGLGAAVTGANRQSSLELLGVALVTWLLAIAALVRVRLSAKAFDDVTGHLNTASAWLREYSGTNLPAAVAGTSKWGRWTAYLCIVVLALTLTLLLIARW